MTDLKYLWYSFIIIFITSFLIVYEELKNGEDIACCPSCSLIIKVIYDFVSIVAYKINTNEILERHTGYRVKVYLSEKRYFSIGSKFKCTINTANFNIERIGLDFC